MIDPVEEHHIIQTLQDGFLRQEFYKYLLLLLQGQMIKLLLRA